MPETKEKTTTFKLAHLISDLRAAVADGDVSIAVIGLRGESITLQDDFGFEIVKFKGKDSGHLLKIFPY